VQASSVSQRRLVFAARRRFREGREQTFAGFRKNLKLHARADLFINYRGL
jgi:hypothetical protein